MHEEYIEESADPLVSEKVKLLVHNVSHADLCLTLQPDCVLGVNPERELMARPRSSRYKYVCEEIGNALKRGLKYSGIALKDKQSRSRFVGFLFDPPARICSWSDFRLRNPNNRTISQSLSVFVVRVFFPLIAVILPKWIALHPVASPSLSLSVSSRSSPSRRSATMVPPKYSLDGRTLSSEHKEDGSTASSRSLHRSDSSSTVNGSRLVSECEATAYKLFLVSGAGHPQLRGSAYYEDDSTQQLSLLICRFIRDFYGRVVVTQFYSKQDIFQYAENIRFVHSKLRPAIDYERSALATLHGKFWNSYFNLSISLCDGTPARLSAIIEGLRSFEPDMLHMYRRKSLWADYPKVDRLWDQDLEYLTFDKMETYPAIPVVDIHDEGVLDTIREMKQWKQDFLDRAVDDPHSEMAHFWLRKTRQPVLAVLAVQKPEDERPTYYRGVNVEVSMPTGSLCAERNAIGAAIAADPSLRREHFKMVAVLFMAELDKTQSVSTPRFSPFPAPPAEAKPTETAASFKPLFVRSRSAPQGNRVSFFKADEAEDTNPRGPCGSCMEWLKKIAQCNPSFKVITFSSRTLERAIVRNLS